MAESPHSTALSKPRRPLTKAVDPLPLLRKAAPASPALRRDLKRLESVFEGVADAYSPATIRGYRADLLAFLRWCHAKNVKALPAKSTTVAQFLDREIEHQSIATVKRRICAITFAHTMLDWPPPTKSKEIQLALRRARRKKPRRPKQVRGVTKEIRSKVLRHTYETLAQSRDATLISVGYDTLCRSSELAAMKVEHIDCETGKILIPRSKADTAGDGRIAYLSPASRRLIQHWLAASALKTGPVFRSLHLQRLGDEPLSTSSIRRLVKRAAFRVGIEEEIAQDLSGHSMRVGAAQDMMVQGFDALAIMQAGGWKSANVVLRYVENASTKELHEKRWSALRAA